MYFSTWRLAKAVVKDGFIRDALELALACGADPLQASAPGFIGSGTSEAGIPSKNFPGRAVHRTL